MAQRPRHPKDLSAAKPGEPVAASAEQPVDKPAECPAADAASPDPLAVLGGQLSELKGALDEFVAVRIDTARLAVKRAMWRFLLAIGAAIFVLALAIAAGVFVLIGTAKGFTAWTGSAALGYSLTGVIFIGLIVAARFGLLAIAERRAVHRMAQRYPDHLEAEE